MEMLYFKDYKEMREFFKRGGEYEVIEPIKPTEEEVVEEVVEEVTEEAVETEVEDEVPADRPDQGAAESDSEEID